MYLLSGQTQAYSLKNKTPVTWILIPCSVDIGSRDNTMRYFGQYPVISFKLLVLAVYSGA